MTKYYHVYPGSDKKRIAVTGIVQQKPFMPPTGHYTTDDYYLVSSQSWAGEDEAIAAALEYAKEHQLRYVNTIDFAGGDSQREA